MTRKAEEPYFRSMIDMSVKIGSLQLKNPILTASGTFGYGTEIEDLIDLSSIGGICTKGLSLEPRVGNLPPRLVETPSGLLNAIGLENVGIDRFIQEKVPLVHKLSCAIIANVLGTTAQEYAELARRLDSVARIDALELNISCPNVRAGGVSFGREPRLAAEVMHAVRVVTKKPVIVKLSPNVNDITEVGRAVEAEGADAVSVINTVSGMAIDIRTRRPMLGNIIGGLSGPAIKPVAVRMVFECARCLKIPVVGIGGIMTWEDAVEFLLAGASCVQVGTASFFDPSAAQKIAIDLEKYVKTEGLKSVSALVGQVRI